MPWQPQGYRGEIAEQPRSVGAATSGRRRGAALLLSWRVSDVPHEGGVQVGSCQGPQYYIPRSLWVRLPLRAPDLPDSKPLGYVSERERAGSSDQADNQNVYDTPIMPTLAVQVHSKFCRKAHHAAGEAGRRAAGSGGRLGAAAAAGPCYGGCATRVSCRPSWTACCSASSSSPTDLRRAAPWSRGRGSRLRSVLTYAGRHLFAEEPPVWPPGGRRRDLNSASAIPSRRLARGLTRSVRQLATPWDIGGLASSPAAWGAGPASLPSGPLPTVDAWRQQQVRHRDPIRSRSVVGSRSRLAGLVRCR
jgi:hypothetical protein